MSEIVKLKGFADRLSRSMWLIALANIKDLFELVTGLIGVVNKGAPLSTINIDWMGVITTTVLAFLVVHLFRALADSKDSIEALKRGYEEQKNKFADQSLVAAVVNAHRLKTIATKDMKFTSTDYENAYLEKELADEILVVRNYLIELNKDRTVNEIDQMLNDFYQMGFGSDAGGATPIK